jgi:CheY-like chemotaxis protein
VSGYEILDALSENEKYRSIPKIIWSTSNSHYFENKCMAKGAVTYFVKPSDITGFQALVQKLQLFFSLPK